VREWEDCAGLRRVGRRGVIGLPFEICIVFVGFVSLSLHWRQNGILPSFWFKW